MTHSFTGSSTSIAGDVFIRYVDNIVVSFTLHFATSLALYSVLGFVFRQPCQKHKYAAILYAL